MKPLNILFTKDKTKLKLCDFGISSELHHQTKVTNDAEGTVRYMSPELHNGKITCKADVWAIGCIVLQFVTGK